ncbi:hypothetical protein F7725_021720 [Dissostichus mawsoni]|uniref:Uncharacterized protein n=1 Tax=Dissostichus mawsoni TaxID=36200 RepID=A0A7J5ZDY5_DISMA|nr:hypothetical protein F7725_021720 [Dissostichus mawsoni]
MSVSVEEASKDTRQQALFIQSVELSLLQACEGGGRSRLGNQRAVQFFILIACDISKVGKCQPNICVTSVGLASVSDPSRCCVLDICVCMYSTCRMHVSERNRVVVKGAPAESLRGRHAAPPGSALAYTYSGNALDYLSEERDVSSIKYTSGTRGETGIDGLRQKDGEKI